VWSALRAYGELECRALCARVAALPRELRDPIYDHILEDFDQNLVLDRIRNGADDGMTYERPLCFDCTVVHPGFLNELMEIYYAKISFELDYVPAKEHSKPTPLNFKLWSLLAQDPFYSACIPAKVVETITINVALNHPSRLDMEKSQPFGVPTSARKIKDARSVVVLKASAVRWRCSEPAIPPTKYLLNRLRRAFTPLIALGVNTKLLYGGKEVAVHPSNPQPRKVSILIVVSTHQPR